LELERDAQQIIDDKVDTIYGAVENIKDFLDNSTIDSAARTELMHKNKEELVNLLLKTEYFQALEDKRKHQPTNTLVQ